MTTRERVGRGLGVGILAVWAGALGVSPGWAQAGAQHPAIVTVEHWDAQRTRGVLALDASLLGNETYLAPYPALVSFLNAHPEIAGTLRSASARVPVRA